jgi:hypothetical protein
MLIGDVISEEEAHPPVVTDPDPSAWFNANISAYGQWPRDVSLSVRGTWSTTADSLADVADMRSDGALAVASGSDELAFDADEPFALGRSVVFDADVLMHSYEAADIPPVDPSWKASIIQVSDEESSAYYGLRRNGSANEWVRLDGAVPAAGGDASVHVRMTFRRRRGETVVTYNVGGVDLSADGVTAIPVVAEGAFSGVVCGGTGSVSSLVAHSDGGQGTLIRICWK